MAELTHDQVERRALALLERLTAYPGNTRLRTRLLRGAPDAVLSRVAQLERAMPRAGGMTTQIPGVSSADGDEAPTRFGAYRMVAPIGRGGMGEVWRGERDDGLFDQTVAIKLIQPHLQIRAGEAFERERRILARLDHPNIARLIDGGTTADGRACLVMEFVDGVPFDQACNGLPLAQQIALFKQVLRAAQYAHGRLIAHGDLKPGNILVDRERRVRLLDFGIARLIADEADDPRVAGAMTSSFASPARLGGEPPTIPDDVFALGRLLQDAIGASADRDLAAVAAKACAPLETLRYASVPEFLADLERWQRRYPVSARPRRRLYVVRHYMRRNWRALIAAGVLGAALGYAAISYDQARRERAEAGARFDDARAAARYLLFTLYDELAALPHSLALRREIAATAQHDLDRLALSASTSAQVNLEAAQGLLRLSQVQGSPLVANLGEPEAAKRNLAAALRLTKTLPGPAARRAELQAELDAADLAEMVDEDQPAAWQHLGAAQRLLGADPAAPARQKYWLIRSLIERWNNQAGAAQADAQRAIAASARSPRLDDLLMLARANEAEGDAIDLLDHHAAAMVLYDRALAVSEQAASRYPADYYARRRLGIALYHSGIMAVRWGDPQRGLAMLQRAVRECQASVASEPDDDNARRSLAIDQLGLAQALAKLGRGQAAMALMGQLVANDRAILASRPGELRRLRDLAVGTAFLGDMQAEFDQAARACANYQAARQLFQAMDASGHLSAADRADTLANVIVAQGKYCKGRVSGA